MREKSDRKKLQEGRGTGHGSEYIPFIKTREIPSTGTCSNPIDVKNGRTYELLSQAELYVYTVLRWSDEVDDIREQMPLDLKETQEIATLLGMVPPSHIMTTDFIVTLEDQNEVAISVKSKLSDFKKPSVQRTSMIQKLYWGRRNIPFRAIAKEQINRVFVHNILCVFEYYDFKNVRTADDYIKHLIAHKKVTLEDFHINELDLRKIKQGRITYGNGITTWKHIDDEFKRLSDSVCGGRLSCSD